MNTHLRVIALDNKQSEIHLALGISSERFREIQGLLGPLMDLPDKSAIAERASEFVTDANELVFVGMLIGGYFEWKKAQVERLKGDQIALLLAALRHGK
jgi:hypothetical protein